MESQTQNDGVVYEKILKINDDLETDELNTIIIEESSNMQLGTGTRVWECSIILLKYFLKQISDNTIKLKGKTILELGAGTGLLSIGLASQGAIVYATDLKPIQDILLKNINANKELINNNKGKVTNFVLQWDMCSYDLKELLEKQIYQKKIDYVVCSDLVFNESHVSEITSCLNDIYELYEPIIYFSHKSRNDEIDYKLIQELESKLFYGEQIEPEEMDPIYQNVRIDIFKFTKDE